MLREDHDICREVSLICFDTLKLLIGQSPSHDPPPTKTILSSLFLPFVSVRKVSFNQLVRTFIST